MVATITLLCLVACSSDPPPALQSVNEEWRSHTAPSFFEDGFTLDAYQLPTRRRSSPSSNPTSTPESSPPSHSSGVEQWRPLVTAHFGADTDRALCLMGFESGGDPGARNPSSGAAGLMQVMPFWAPEYGVSYEALFDPETNILIAKGIRDSQGWTAWSPYKRGECR